MIRLRPLPFTYWPPADTPAAPPSTDRRTQPAATPESGCPTGRTTTWRAAITTVAAALPLGVGLAAALSLRAQNHFLRRAYEQARYEADHDPLTGLPNRALALRALTQVTNGQPGDRTPASPSRSGTVEGPGAPGVAVGLLDLDDFKAVNDRYGHHTGDQLLVAVAARLRDAVAGVGLVARLAGDEFLIIWTGAPTHPTGTGRLLLQQVTAALEVDGVSLSPAASLGIVAARRGWPAAAVLKAADEAMYEAKTGARAPGTPYGVSVYGGDQPPAATDRRTPQRRLDPPARPPHPHQVHPSGGDRP